MSEFELIARLGPHLAEAGGNVVVGTGDDAAVLRFGGRGLCVAVDVVVDGVHVRRDLSSMADVGWKAVAVNCSDLAAMGAMPRAGVVGLCRPPREPEAGLADLYAGMAQAGRRYGLALVGGDTVSGDQLVVSLTVVGEVPLDRMVLRAGARPGDRLVLVGALGAGAAALAAVAAGLAPAAPLLAAHRRPQALVTAGRVLAERGATAMIDVSDGLGADLGHLCTASAVSACVEWTALPVAAGVLQVAAATGVDPVALVCGGGEDFALLAALPADRAGAAAAAAGGAEGVTAAVVGHVREARPEGGPAVRLRLPGGEHRPLDGLGYDHYRHPGRERQEQP